MLSNRHYEGNPQKNSPALGATIAYLGINGVLALLHGAQGCSTFIRLQLSRHFKENIPLNSTAVAEDSVIFGGWENLKQGMAVAIDKFHPQIVGVMSSGLTETYGDDMNSALAALRQERPDIRDIPIIVSSTPDYIGSMQEGFQRTVLSILKTVLDEPGKEQLAAPEGKKYVTLFPGLHFTPGDVEVLKEIVEQFGLYPLAVPDLSTSLDGHTELDPSPVVQGGTELDDIYKIPNSIAAFSFGLSMKKAGQYVQEKFGLSHFNIPSLTGLKATDHFIEKLCHISGKTVPNKLRQQRKQLLDILVDYHDQIGDKKIALALETDLLYSLSTALLEAGACPIVALAASEQGIKHFPESIPAQVGDLEHLEEMAKGAHLIIANTNARQSAVPLKIPHLRAGLPVFDRVGENLKVWIGYRGTYGFISDVLNTMAE